MNFDLILLGGGLFSGLLGLRLKKTRPDLRFVILERDSILGGEHTWSFHSTDVPPEDENLVQPLISKSWKGYDVHFPAYSRTLIGGYHSILSSRFHEVLSRELIDHIRFRADVQQATGQEVTLRSGEILEANCVIDARGFGPRSASVPSGYQKFVGWDVELEAPHGLTRPVIKDVTIPQLDGYRFFYLLPWSDTEVLVEDTRYSNSPKIDVHAFDKEVQEYIAKKGWKVKTRVRHEVGCLPIPLWDESPDPSTSKQLKLGVSGGYFHPTTGYSFPDAMRLSREIARLSELTPSSIRSLLIDYRRQHARTQGFTYLLNRMLFLGASPDKRWSIMQRFYKLPEDLIARFYSGLLTWRDRVRILTGKPPIPIHAALKCMWARSPETRLD